MSGRKIISGLTQALAHVKGKTTNVREWYFYEDACRSFLKRPRELTMQPIFPENAKFVGQEFLAFSAFKGQKTFFSAKLFSLETTKTKDGGEYWYMVMKSPEGNEYLSRFNKYGLSSDSWQKQIVLIPEESEWE